MISARIKSVLVTLFLLFILPTSFFAAFAHPAYAQSSSESSTNPDVPKNDHTKSQTVLIESMSAIICQIAGVDVVNPNKGCLGVDPQTKKIGYVETDSLRPGGLLGAGTDMIGFLYTPPASGVRYMAHVFDNFGISKSAYAQSEDETTGRSGVDQLKPIEGLWIAAKNMTYIFFVIIFILIGVGIMLRFKIDPRTVMSIQNQIPKIVIGILMITFSFAIVGFLIDLMWLGTYVGINMIAPAAIKPSGEKGITCNKLDVKAGAYRTLLDNPISFANYVLGEDQDCRIGGLFSVSGSVGDSIGSIVSELIKGLITGNAKTDCNITNIGDCLANGVSSILGGVANIITKLIAVIALLVILFRLWFSLLKAYAYIIVYTILGPFWILLGLLPGGSLGFSAWIRTITAKLVTFPVAAFFILIARVIIDVYSAQSESALDPNGSFVPPLIGNPQVGVFGPLLAFAILAITPEVVGLMETAFKAPAGKLGGAVTGGFKAGTVIPGAIAGAVSGKLMARDSKTGGATGTVSRALDRYVLGSNPHNIVTRGIQKGLKTFGGTPNEFQRKELDHHAAQEGGYAEKLQAERGPLGRFFSRPPKPTGDQRTNQVTNERNSV